MSHHSYPHICTTLINSYSCWGEGGYGLGPAGRNEVGIDRPRPTHPSSITTALGIRTYISDIVAGGDSTCAVANGEVYCWGTNDGNRLAIDSRYRDTSQPTKVKTEGTPLHNKKISQLHIGTKRLCTLLEGKIYCWGSHLTGWMGSGGPSDRIITRPTMIKTEGTPLHNKKISQIAMTNHGIYALSNGVIYYWSGTSENPGTTPSNTPRELQVPSSSPMHGKRVSQISAHAYTGCALAENKIYCWGRNDNGQFGNGTTTSVHTTQNSPVQVNTHRPGDALYNKIISKVITDGTTACALAEGRVYCWGSFWKGTPWRNKLEPTLVGGDFPRTKNKYITDLTYTKNQFCGIAENRIYCWGYDGNGIIGHNINNTEKLYQSVPVMGTPDTRHTFLY